MFIEIKFSGLQVLYGLAKRWFQELKDCKEKPLQAHFLFKTSLMSTLNQISCNLCASFKPVVDEFDHCQVSSLLIEHTCMQISIDSGSVFCEHSYIYRISTKYMYYQHLMKCLHAAL